MSVMEALKRLKADSPKEKRIFLKVSDKEKNKIREIARGKGITMSQLIIDSIEKAENKKIKEVQA